jgi:hypothetical protein
VDESRTARARRNTRQPSPRSPHPLGTPPGLSTNTGPLASSAWLADRGVVPDASKWFVEITLAAGAATRLQLDVYAEEWGIQLVHGGARSWVRVTDVAFAHGRDDFDLLARMPRLRDIALWIRQLEHELDIRFDRDAAQIRTNITGADTVVRAWVVLV